MHADQLTLNQLRSFVLVATTGTFSGAAAELHMTQPSVSELIKRVEDRYSLKLFTRGTKRMTLTAAGEELLPFAQLTVDTAVAADRALRSITSLTGGVATFGLLRNANYYFLSRLMDTFHRHHPEVRLRIIGLNSVEVADAVSAGDLEAGLVVLPIDSDGLTVTPLMRDEVVFASADASKTASPVTISDLAATDLILYDAHYGWRDPTRRQLAERAQLEGITLKPLIEVEHVETALSIVASGAGDTIVSRAVVAGKAFPENVTVVGFEEPLYDTIAMIQRESSILSPATREIARLATRMLLDH
jgi:DNA-binding transcriptional LysR family regulator